MASQTHLHFVLIPHLAQGHMIPIIDLAKLLAQRGVTVTVVTTPLNASRFDPIINRAITSGLHIQLLRLPFLGVKAGLPQDCESMDTLPSRDHVKNLRIAIGTLQKPMEQLFYELNPRPSCIISDKNIVWAADTARKFGIPRLVFDGTSCFSLLATHNIIKSKAHETVTGSELFVVPGFPDHIELTRAQLPGAVNLGKDPNRDEVRIAEEEAYGVVVNTFEELESAYVEEFRKVRGGRVWSIGPVSLCNDENLDKFERGNKASIDENLCLKWLDSQRHGSVVYACLGSLSRLTTGQLVELGLGLEASNHPFIWVVSGGSKSNEFEKWVLVEGFEERIKGRGLLIRGWAPQVLILSHVAVGGFLTHCGWNSTIEGVCAGVPMLTWPMFAEQFYNEKFVVQVLKIGVMVGVDFVVKWGDEEKFGVLIDREKVKNGVKDLMSEEEGGEERRKRARESGEKAKRAMENGGSSYLNLTLLVQDILQQVVTKHSKA